MSDMLVGIVIGCVGSAFLFYLWFKMMIARAERELESLVSETGNAITTQVIPARVEEYAGMFYVYSTRDNTFIAQGNTVAELRERIESRWKTAHVFVTEGDESVVAALKSTKNETTSSSS